MNDVTYVFVETLRGNLGDLECRASDYDDILARRLREAFPRATLRHEMRRGSGSERTPYMLVGNAEYRLSDRNAYTDALEAILDAAFSELGAGGEA